MQKKCGQVKTKPPKLVRWLSKAGHCSDKSKPVKRHTALETRLLDWVTFAGIVCRHRVHT